MKTDSFCGRDFITLLEWSKEEVETILDVALDLKRRYALGELHDHILRPLHSIPSPLGCGASYDFRRHTVKRNSASSNTLSTAPSTRTKP